MEVEDRPVPLIHAVAEYAFRALSSSLIPDPASATEAGGQIKRIRQKVGPIEEEKEYETGGGQDGTQTIDGRPVPVYPEADFLLRPLLKTSGNKIIRN